MTDIREYLLSNEWKITDWQIQYMQSPIGGPLRVQMKLTLFDDPSNIPRELSNKERPSEDALAKEYGAINLPQTPISIITNNSPYILDRIRRWRKKEQ